MRVNLVAMLDQIGAAGRLGLDSCEEPLGAASSRLHSISAIRYPVFFEGGNHRGSPKIGRSRLLTSLVNTKLPFELGRFPNPLIVPLGKAVEEALEIAEIGNSPRLLKGFPHLSGANGHRRSQLESEYRRLRRAVRAWTPTTRDA